MKKINYALIQWPNLPLAGWAALSLMAMALAEGSLKNGLKNTATALLFVWAYQEISSGTNLFRRILGIVVMAVMVINFFR